MAGCTAASVATILGKLIAGGKEKSDDMSGFFKRIGKESLVYDESWTALIENAFAEL
ncbi:hypothetical protein FACS189449_03250 [Alphaproteobacteria bacterium]|nr:hypothetical protein FACS189449_03250 [Alphaproteobacteria bacterium]